MTSRGPCQSQPFCDGSCMHVFEQSVVIRQKYPFFHSHLVDYTYTTFLFLYDQHYGSVACFREEDTCKSCNQSKFTFLVTFAFTFQR